MKSKDAFEAMKFNQENTPSVMRATLTERVRRIKPSLAGFHYHLEIGSLVYITDWLGRSVRATEVADPSQRISEDFFELSFDTFEVKP